MLSRRDVLTQLALAGAALKFAPAELLAQAPTAAQRYGKEKLIIRSMRPPDFETPVSLLEYDTGGALRQTLSIASGGLSGSRLTAAGSSTSEGYLSLSADRLSLAVAKLEGILTEMSARRKEGTE